MTHWPKTPVLIDGRRYDLCWSLGAVAAAQEAFERRGVEVNLLDGLPALNLANVRTMWPYTLRKYHPGLAQGAATALVTWTSVYPIAVALRAAWQAGAPVPAEDERRKGKVASERPTPPKSPTKDQQWERLWSLARYDLGLSTEEFYDLTSGQLDALMRRREREIEESEFMSAQIAACVVNFSMSRPEKAVSTVEFMPSHFRRKQERAKRVDRKRVVTDIRSMMTALMTRRT